jgi:predicted PurR-regulated permease PerM
MAVVIAAAAVFILYRVRHALVTVALAAMLAYALRPLVDDAARLRVAGRTMPRLAAVLTVFILLGLIIAALVRLAAGPASAEAARFAQNLAQYRGQIGAYLTRTQVAVHQSMPAPLVGPLDRALDQSETIMLGAVTNIVRGAARWVSHAFEVLLIPVLAFYFLLDLPLLRQELLGFLPSAARRTVQTLGHRADGIVAGYVRAQITLMLISGIVVGVGLAVIGVPFPLLLGVLAGLTRAIPVIGPVIGAIPIVGIAAMQSPGTAIAVLIFFVVLQIVETQIVLPKIIGLELRLHAATILLALLIGNALFGLMGMFLAPPAAAFVKALRETFDAAEPAPGGVAAEAPDAVPAAAGSLIR